MIKASEGTLCSEMGRSCAAPLHAQDSDIPVDAAVLALAKDLRDNVKKSRSLRLQMRKSASEG